ncbi:MAG: glutaredoxin family protein [Candidatus Hodarchaeota archaeon]
MLESLEYKEVDGPVKTRDLKVYALSTCGFCARTIAFLRKKEICFKYVYYDLLDDETKPKVKAALKELYSGRLGFPILVFDGKIVLLGLEKKEIIKLMDIQ